MTWTAPTNVTTGNALTSLLWNNQLGASGSLVYLYNTLTPVSTARNVVLRRSTNLTLSAGVASDVAFDTIITTYTNQQQNFAITTPVTNIPLPSSGMYAVSFLYAHSIASNVTVRFIVTNGTTAEFQSSGLAYLVNVPIMTSGLIFSESSSCTLTVSVLANVAGTGTASAPSGTAAGNMVLRVVKVSL